MQPGLRRMAPGEIHLHPLERGSALWLEKQAVVRSGAAIHCVAGFDPSDAINSIANHALSTGAFSQFDSGTPLALRCAEDLAVLQPDGRVPWMCVCTPSHWAPEDKLGLSLAQIHAPVADAQVVRDASSALARLVTSGQAWERWVWTISPSGRFDQHPRRHARDPWPALRGPQEFAQGCWMRSERQTFFPVHDSRGAPVGQSIFTIGVRLETLTGFVRDADTALQLHASLSSMSDTVLAYKGLTHARAPLLQWLSDQVPSLSRSLSS